VTSSDLATANGPSSIPTLLPRAHLGREELAHGVVGEILPVLGDMLDRPDVAQHLPPVPAGTQGICRQTQAAGTERSLTKFIHNGGFSGKKH
jgi:hypothetical protein